MKLDHGYQLAMRFGAPLWTVGGGVYESGLVLVLKIVKLRNMHSLLVYLMKFLWKLGDVEEVWVIMAVLGLYCCYRHHGYSPYVSWRNLTDATGARSRDC